MLLARLPFQLLWLFGFFQNTEIPFKPKDEFQVETKFELKQRPVNDRYHIDYNETWDDRNRSNATQLPYLIVNLRFLKFSEGEVRVKGYNNQDEPICNKKAEENLLVKLNLGFTDDVKDHVAPYEFNVFTYSKTKAEVYRIHMLVTEDGTFLVNGEIRGKF